jgi:hypothetical protein
MELCIFAKKNMSHAVVLTGAMVARVGMWCCTLIPGRARYPHFAGSATSVPGMVNREAAATRLAAVLMT